MSALQKKLFNAKGLPPRPTGPFSRKGGFASKKDFSPTSWSDYFDEEQEVYKPGSTNRFHIYKKGKTGPIILFLHGGGFSGLSWALLSKCLANFVHCQCVAIDQRGHGKTTTDDEYLLSADQLASDVKEIVELLLEKEETPFSTGVVLVGHSMGGAVAIHAAVQDKAPNLVGLVVIDVVEGSALESLHAMHGVLKNRPKSFESVEKANEWCVKTGYVRNLESARVSMVGQLKKLDVPIEVPTRHFHDFDAHDVTKITSPAMGAIAEDEDDSPKAAGTSVPRSPATQQPTQTKTHHYTWRIDLSKTSKYWEGWFKGMSSMFLSCNVPKMLMLAGVDRLDTQLTAAQMQGKFQMQVLSRSGHAVHEDVPDKVAEAIAAFLVRHKFAEPASEFERPFPCC